MSPSGSREEEEQQLQQEGEEEEEGVQFHLTEEGLGVVAAPTYDTRGVGFAGDRAVYIYVSYATRYARGKLRILPRLALYTCR